MSLETAHISVIRQTFAAIGADLPKPVTKALAERDKLATTRPAPIATPDEIADAVADCLLAGRDPLEDEHVRRLTISRALGGATGNNLAHIVNQAAERRIVAAFRESVDDLLDTLAETADTAGQQLTDAHAIIGDRDLTDSDLILRLGPEAARAWAEARDAGEVLRKIDSAWHSLRELTQFGPSSSSDPSLRLADLDLETVEKVGRKADGWSIVRAGGRIDLADATTIRERIERISDARQQRETGRANAPQDAWAAQHKVGVAG